MSRMRLLLGLFVLVSLVASETRPDISLDDVVAVVGQKFEYLVGDEKFLAEYEIYKIVERGNRKLPEWLSFDKNTSLLVGVPLEKDVGIYTIRMRACFMEKTNTECQNKISRSFQIDVVEPLRAESERGSHTVSMHAGNDNIQMHRGSLDIYPGTMHEILTNKHGYSRGHKIQPNKDKIHFRPCESNEITFYASLLLHVKTSLSGFERAILIDCMSKFLSKNVSAFSLSQYNLGLTSASKYIIAAGPGNIIESVNNSIELSWHVACGQFEHVSDFSKILQHNIDSGRLTEETNFGIIAWYVYTDKPLPRRMKRNAHNGRRQTATPSFTPPLPSTLTHSDVTDSAILTSQSEIETSFLYSTATLLPVFSSSVLAKSMSPALTPLATSDSLLTSQPVFFSTVLTPSLSPATISAEVLDSSPMLASSSSPTTTSLDISDSSKTSLPVYSYTMLASHSISATASLEITDFLVTSQPLFSSALTPSSILSATTPYISDSSVLESLHSFDKLITSTSQSTAFLTSFAPTAITTHPIILSTSSLKVVQESLLSYSLLSSIYRFSSTDLVSVNISSLSTKPVSTVVTSLTVYNETKSVSSRTHSVDFVPSYFSSSVTGYLVTYISSFSSQFSERSALIDSLYSETATHFSPILSSVIVSQTPTSVLLTSFHSPLTLIETSVASTLQSYVKTSYSAKELTSLLLPTSVSFPIYSSPLSLVSFPSVTDVNISLPVSSITLSETYSAISSGFSYFSSSNLRLSVLSETLMSERFSSSLNSSLVTSKIAIPSTYFLYTSSSSDVTLVSASLYFTLTTLSKESSFYKISEDSYITSSIKDTVSFDITTESLFSILESSSDTYFLSLHSLGRFSVDSSQNSLEPSATVISSLPSAYIDLTDYISTFSFDPSRITNESLLPQTSDVIIINNQTVTKSSLNSSQVSNLMPQTTPTSAFFSFSSVLPSTMIISTDVLSMYPSFSTTTNFSSFLSQSESHYSLSYSSYSSELYITTILLTSLSLILKSSSYFLTSSLTPRLFSPLSSKDFSTTFVPTVSPYLTLYPTEPYSSVLSMSGVSHLFTSSVKFSTTLRSDSATSLISGFTFMSMYSDTSTESTLSLINTLLPKHTTLLTIAFSPVITASLLFNSSEPLPYIHSDSIFLSVEASQIDLFSLFSTETSTSQPSSELSLNLSLISTNMLTPSLSSLVFESIYNKTLKLVSSVSATSAVPSVPFSSVIVPVSSSASVKVELSVTPSSLTDFPSSVYLLSSKIPSTAIPDGSPMLQNPINQLQVHVGKYFEYYIPSNTFNDTEDGDTRNLTLSVTKAYGKPLPKGAWLMFNESSQTLYGIPLWQDIVDEKKDKIMTIILVAKDSAGQIAKDAIQLTYNKSHVMGHSHKIDLNFNGSYKDFMKSRDSLVNVAKDIARFYGDMTLKFLTFLEVKARSLNVIWSNSSLAGEQCDREKIQEMFDKLVDVNGSVSEKFEDLFSKSSMNIMSVTLEFVGVCLLPVTTLAPPIVTNPPESSADDDKMWIEVVIPALVAILVVVIVALILLICCRHRRSKKKLSKSEKPMFLEDRRPIIFPEELEMTDPNLKPKTPLVLPSDLISDTPPPVPPHRGREPPHYQVPPMEDEVFLTDNRPSPPPHFEQSQASDPPPYRLPPPYFNPHRSNR